MGIVKDVHDDVKKIKSEYTDKIFITGAIAFLIFIGLISCFFSGLKAFMRKVGLGFILDGIYYFWYNALFPGFNKENWQIQPPPKEDDFLGYLFAIFISAWVCMFFANKMAKHIFWKIVIYFILLGFCFSFWGHFIDPFHYHYH